MFCFQPAHTSTCSRSQKWKSSPLHLPRILPFLLFFLHYQYPKFLSVLSSLLAKEVPSATLSEQVLGKKFSSLSFIWEGVHFTFITHSHFPRTQNLGWQCLSTAAPQECCGPSFWPLHFTVRIHCHSKCGSLRFFSLYLIFSSSVMCLSLNFFCLWFLGFFWAIIWVYI